MLIQTALMSAKGCIGWSTFTFFINVPDYLILTFPDHWIGTYVSRKESIGFYLMVGVFQNRPDNTEDLETLTDVQSISPETVSATFLFYHNIILNLHAYGIFSSVQFKYKSHNFG